MVEAQYSGAKSSLRPLYNHIVEFAQSLGSDVAVAPKKSSVSLRRAKQFALVTPATKARIDLGLASREKMTWDDWKPIMQCVRTAFAWRQSLTLTWKRKIG